MEMSLLRKTYRINVHLSLLFSPLLFFGTFSQGHAQEMGMDESIAEYRKGELTIKASPGDQIHVEQMSHEFWFGAAISNSLASGSFSEEDLKQYKEKFLKNFNAAVTENAVKWASMEPQEGEVNYDIVDGILEWTVANDIPLRGHNLYWGIPKFVQDWLKVMDDEELKATLQRRVEDITSRYKGRFVEYDLNNEMVHGNYYEERLGPEVTKWMAEWALNGDHDAQLFLNDYNILTGKSLPRYMDQIRNLLKQGVPIAGIGVQGHSHGVTFDREELRRALDSLAIFDLPIRITEFNMPGQNSKFHRENIKEMTAEEAALNASELVDFYKACFSHPAVEGILMWGFWEGANWIPVSSLYNRDWSPSASAIAYQELIFNEWWTSTSGKADVNGVFTLPAFYGKYKVIVNGEAKEVELKKNEGKAVFEF